jgi:2-keto-4-pentenoate hydratase
VCHFTRGIADSIEYHAVIDHMDSSTRPSVMTDAQQQQASDLLWTAWQQGERMASLPEAVRPLTRQDGYAVQARLEARSASALFGWKIAATSKAGQTHIAVGGPLAGRLLSERVRESGGEVPFGRNHMRVAEAEFAFRFGRDLLPRETPYSMDEVLAAVATLHPAIEIPDSRYDDFTIVGAPQLIADNACAHYFFAGPAAPDSWRSVDLAAHAVLGTVAGKLQREGRGSNVLGDPRIALTWLVNELSSIGVPLRAGQLVTTGTCLVPLEIAPGDRVTADFGPLGSIEARIGE